MSAVLVEVAVEDGREAGQAAAAGARRLELCAALALGGLTPTFSALEGAREGTRLPLMAMVRPRAGGFVYDPFERDRMLRDARWLLSHGADGIVFGCLTETGQIDRDSCRRLVEAAGEASTVFHRAIDSVPALETALDDLIGCGVTRVLTGGGRRRALDGAGTIRRLQERAAGRIEILAGGGIRAENTEAVLQATGCSQIHLGPRRPRPHSIAATEVDFGAGDVLDTDAVAAVLRRCNLASFPQSHEERPPRPDGRRAREAEP